MGELYRNIDLGAPHDNPEFPLGAIGQAGDDLFRYILFNDADEDSDAVAGHLLVGIDTGESQWEVTNNMDSATIKALTNDPVGFAQYAMTNGQYGWAQFSGFNRETIITDGSVTQNQLLMAHPTTTGGVDTWATTNAVIGVARETDNVSSQLTAGQAKITIPGN